MATITELRSDYTERSWDYELPDHLEQALEDDYVQNSHLYFDNAFKCISFAFKLNSEITSQELLDIVRVSGKLD